MQIKLFKFNNFSIFGTIWAVFDVITLASVTLPGVIEFQLFEFNNLISIKLIARGERAMS